MAAEKPVVVADPQVVAPDAVARAVVAAYESLRLPTEAEGTWTVVAGIIAADAGELTVLSLGAGCKCVGGCCKDDDDGFLIRDAHAEVLARRGLVAYLMHERLKEGASLHFYVSAAPCGDAAIYELRDGSLAYTGAKLGDWRREDQQVLSATRLKPGRSDVPEERRTRSLSCTDKICKWAMLGVQGALLPIVRFASVTVGVGPEATEEAALAALERGIAQRIRHYGGSAPLLLTTRIRPNNAALRDGGGPSSTLGVSWHLNGSVEVLNSAKGVKQGATAKATRDRKPAARSCLATAAIFQTLVGQSTLRELKLAAPDSDRRRELDTAMRADLYPASTDDHRKRPRHGPPKAADDDHGATQRLDDDDNSTSLQCSSSSSLDT